MREYELTVIYSLAVSEAGGPDAAVESLTGVVGARGGEVLKVDHWGRRRMAYPIGDVLDGDYVIMRANLEPTAVTPLEAALRIDEKVFRHIVVRADELPIPLPPREPRRMPDAAPVAGAPGAPLEAAAPAPAEAAAPTEAVAPAEAAAPAAPEAPAAEAAPEAPAAEAAPEAPAAAAPAAEEPEAPAPAEDAAPA